MHVNSGIEIYQQCTVPNREDHNEAVAMGLHHLKRKHLCKDIWTLLITKVQQDSFELPVVH